jgi:hypothetical protein
MLGVGSGFEHEHEPEHEQEGGCRKARGKRPKRAFGQAAWLLSHAAAPPDERLPVAGESRGARQLRPLPRQSGGKPLALQSRRAIIAWPGLAHLARRDLLP